MDQGIDQGIIIGALGLLLALVLVALNGLFVAAEFAFTRLRATRVDSMVREGRASAQLVKKGTQNLDVYLAVCQVGITVASLGLGALGEPAVGRLLRPLLSPFLPEGLVHAVSFAVAFGLITFLHVTYGELASKTVAIARPEGSAQFTAPFMEFFRLLFAPAIWLFNGTANTSVRLFGIPPASETEEQHSEEELRVLVGQSSSQGVLEEGEASLVRAAFELDEKVAREVMVPKTKVAPLSAGLGLSGLVAALADGEHVRRPVCEQGRADRVVGTVHAKDVLRAAKAHGGLDADVAAGDVMHDVLTVPGSRRVDGILKELQSRGIRMAVVVDEWGSFEGVITIEDILEEIVGDIRGEWAGTPKQDIRRLDDGSYVLDGSVPVRDANEVLGAGFEDGRSGTIGGLVFGYLGRAPAVGDELRLDGYALRVEETDGPRVARVGARREDG